MTCRLAPFLLAICLLAGGCASTRSGPVRPAKINHLAFFTLVDPDDAAELIADCDSQLSSIPGVKSYYAGPPLDTGRDRVDGSYDVGFYVGFDSVDDYMTYVNHPNHVGLVEKWQARLTSLRVHDVLDETP